MREPKIYSPLEILQGIDENLKEEIRIEQPNENSIGIISSRLLSSDDLSKIEHNLFNAEQANDTFLLRYISPLDTSYTTKKATLFLHYTRWKPKIS